jgi:hypothetical protein
MRYPSPKINIEGKEYDLISYDEFRDKRGLMTLSNQTLINHLDKGNLDFTILGRFRYIVWNEKAQNFNLSYQKQLTA